MSEEKCSSVMHWLKPLASQKVEWDILQ